MYVALRLIYVSPFDVVSHGVTDVSRWFLNTSAAIDVARNQVNFSSVKLHVTFQMLFALTAIARELILFHLEKKVTVKDTYGC